MGEADGGCLLYTSICILRRKNDDEQCRIRLVKTYYVMSFVMHHLFLYILTQINLHGFLNVYWSTNCHPLGGQNCPAPVWCLSTDGGAGQQDAYSQQILNALYQIARDNEIVHIINGLNTLVQMLGRMASGSEEDSCFNS